MEGEPYVTAEFANKKSQVKPKFPVGDGKYYSKTGVTEERRKRRATCESTVKLHAKQTFNLLYRKSSIKSPGAY